MEPLSRLDSYRQSDGIRVRVEGALWTGRTGQPPVTGDERVILNLRQPLKASSSLVNRPNLRHPR